jgi:hypothetical protein
MKIGQEKNKAKKPELTEDSIKAKLTAYGRTLNASNEKIQGLRNQLAGELDRNKLLVGAIRGLQDLLPKGEEVVDPSEKDVPVDVPQTDSAEPRPLPESVEGPKEAPADDERAGSETAVES